MTKQLSFTKIENELLPKFRKTIGSAESTEDVKKFYVYTIQELLNKVFAGTIKFDYNDISLTPDDNPSFSLNKQLYDMENFTTVWYASDLPHVVARFTESCVNHYHHLEKNRAKTESKIRM